MVTQIETKTAIIPEPDISHCMIYLVDNAI